MNAPIPERDPAERRRLSNAYEAAFPTVRARRHRGFYNCWGLALASRRTWVEDDYFRILKEDGYHKIEKDEARSGDLVLYRLFDEVQHVAVITNTTLDGEIFVISQWGQVGEFTHHVDNVMEWLGTPSEYWSERELTQ